MHEPMLAHLHTYPVWFAICSRRYIRYTFNYQPGASEPNPGADEPTGGVCRMWDACWGEVECGNLRESLIETDLNCRVRKVMQP